MRQNRGENRSVVLSAHKQIGNYAHSHPALAGVLGAVVVLAIAALIVLIRVAYKKGRGK